MSYLYQAATYLALHGNDTQKEQTKGTDSDASMEDIDQCQSKVEANVTGSCQSLSRRLISEFRLVSQKGMMRISPEMKHSMCKNCQTLLMEGTTCTAHVENRSKGGKKPWADVLVRKCNTCGLEKRFPLAAERQPRRPRRSTKEVPASKFIQQDTGHTWSSSYLTGVYVSTTLRWTSSRCSHLGQAGPAKRLFITRHSPFISDHYRIYIPSERSTFNPYELILIM